MGKGTSIGLHTFVPSKKPWLPGFVYVASFWVSLEDQLHHYGYFGAFKAVKGGRGGGGEHMPSLCHLLYHTHMEAMYSQISALHYRWL